jgi:hypothetical protein
MPHSPAAAMPGVSAWRKRKQKQYTEASHIDISGVLAQLSVIRHGAAACSARAMECNEGSSVIR